MTTASAIANHARSLVAQRQFAEAINRISNFLQNTPGTAEVFYWLGVAYAQSGNKLAASDAFKQGVAADNSFSLAYNGWALANVEMGEYQLADEICAQGFAQPNPDIKLYFTWAKVKRDLGDLVAALELFSRAQEASPNNPQVLANKAGILADMGEKQAAIQCYHAALNVNPALVHLHEYIADLTQYQSEQDEHIVAMQSAAIGKHAPHALAGVEFGLAKAYEQLKNYQLAAQFYTKANGRLHQQRPYQHRQLLEKFGVLKTVFTPQAVAHWRAAVETKANASVRPIFVVGMPRSGTSLVEQILASHPNVTGAGELRFLKMLLLRVTGCGGDNYHLGAQKLTPDHIITIREEYLRLIQPFAQGCEYLVDKMPLNCRFIGLILAAFPEAKIVYCQRNREDVMLSNFKANFFSDLTYSRDLTAAGQFYDATEQLCEHWRNCFGSALYPLNYQTLVSDQVNQTEQLLSYCDLPWAEECLAFYKTKRRVATASSQQVKQPMHTGAVNYWENFAPYLPQLQQKSPLQVDH